RLVGAVAGRGHAVFADIGNGAGSIEGAAVGGVGAVCVRAGEAHAWALEATVVAFAVIGPVAGVGAEIDVAGGGLRAVGGRGGRRGAGGQGHGAGLEGGAAIGGVAQLVGRDREGRRSRTRKARIVALAVIGPGARVVAEIYILGESRPSHGQRQSQGDAA